MSSVIVGSLVALKFATRPYRGILNDRPASGHNPFVNPKLGVFCLLIRMDKRCVSIITHYLQIHGVCC